MKTSRPDQFQPSPTDGVSSRLSARVGRRAVVKAGAVLVPMIVTLRAMPAWAQVDYTQTAYRYGVGAGLCKNPKFNPSAAPGSTAGTEFIPCP